MFRFLTFRFSETEIAKHPMHTELVFPLLLCCHWHFSSLRNFEVLSIAHKNKTLIILLQIIRQTNQPNENMARPRRSVASDTDGDGVAAAKRSKVDHGNEGDEPTKEDVAIVFGVLVSTGDIQEFTSVMERDEFVKEYDDIVTETKEFGSVAAFEEWKRAKRLSTPSPKSVMTKSEGLLKMSPDDARKVQAAVSRVRDSRPLETIVVDWKTTPRSMAVCLVIRMVDRSESTFRISDFVNRKLTATFFFQMGLMCGHTNPISFLLLSTVTLRFSRKRMPMLPKCLLT